MNKAINIVGYPGGAFGIGEDARSLKIVLNSINNYSKYILPSFRLTPANIGIQKEDIGVMKKGDLNIFAMSPMDMIGLALSKDSSLIYDAGYSIGAWPWELPVVPNKLENITNLVDEIWAQSSFVERAFKSIGNTNIKKMPMLVSVDGKSSSSRKKYNIPENDYIFYMMFDGNSWVSRKNPISTIRAFQKSFKGISNGVGLVVKVMNTLLAGPVWDEFLSLATNDHRVIIIDQVLSSRDLLDLAHSCDCYVSLHRSEGFGRCIAEAMLLEIPVIVSNFSGNTDFCNSETAFLVEGEKIPVKPGDYIFHENQFWFDADLQEASDLMSLVIDDPSERSKIAKNGKKFIEDHHSLDAITPIYKEALKKIIS
jgi:glycosyltransferase involved in cell wall biosynthesis